MPNSNEIKDKTNINWFPGHMAKAIRQIKEKINMVDIIIELNDARAPIASLNPVIQELIKGKFYLKILTKIDLADDVITKEWQSYYQKNNIYCLFLNLNKKDSFSKILRKVNEVMKPQAEKDIKRNLKPRTPRAMVLGIPNVGKSTFINTLVKKKSAGVANKPGFTRSQQWIRCEGLDMLDTPGILWPNLEDNQSGLKLALLGSIKNDILPENELALIAIKFLSKNYPKMLYNRYGINVSNDYYSCIEQIANKRGHLNKNGKVDIGRTSSTILNDFKNGLFGKISLERCADDGWF